MNNIQLKAGIVGLGRWGQILAKSINEQHSSLLKFTHCFTRTIEKVKTFCNKYDLTICNLYENLINNNDIDIIVLATPHTQHCEQIIKAANAKKHIFVEKPFGGYTNVNIGNIPNFKNILEKNTFHFFFTQILNFFFIFWIPNTKIMFTHHLPRKFFTRVFFS